MWSLRRKAAIFGLDIGSSAVKVVEIAPGRNGALTLTACQSVPLPQHAVAEGAIRDSAAVSDAVRECVLRAGIRSRAAAISIAGRETITKRLSLPRVSLRELADAIILEAEHHIPFAMDEVLLDHQVLSASATSMDVLLVAVKRAKVLDQVAVVESAGFEASVVDLDAFALQNQFELNGPLTGGEAVALVDIGATFMTTNVVRDGIPILVRDVPLGGHRYTEAIARRLQVSFEQAEAVKQGQDAGVAWTQVMPALESVSRELSFEVQRAFDHLASGTEPARIGRIVLSGGGAELAGLDEFLGSAWGIPVERARPFRAVQADEARWSEEDLARTSPAMAVALGLSLRRPGDRSS